MITKILLATNNKGKVERFKKLFTYVDEKNEVVTPSEINLEVIDVEEVDETLAENAILKVKAYEGKTNLCVLANDTGLFVEGEGFISTPKRTALEGVDENVLTKEEIAQKLLDFWKGIATKHGGKVNAAWVEVFALLTPDGKITTAESRREIILTDTEFGSAHIQMPVRALYYSKATNKPAILHTDEEEIIEMQPVIEALKELVKSV